MKLLTSGEVLGEADAPRVAWSYWDKGFANLSDFRKLCVETWKILNPGWEVIILDATSVWDYVGVSDLPRQWEDMYVPFQADAVRLALLAKYGGLWIDPATICLKPFDWWIYDTIRSKNHVEGIGAFYFSTWGVDMGHSAEYVENWILAARRAHPLIIAWKALFNSFWDDVRIGTLDPVGLPEHPMFRDVNLTFLQRYGHDMRAYLVMHACFKKLIDQDEDMRHIWRHEMLLLRADDHALWHMDEPDVRWSLPAGMQKWLQDYDPAWVDYVVKNCPVLKFMKQFANLLDVEPRQRYLEEDGYPRCSLSAAFHATLAFEPAD